MTKNSFGARTALDAGGKNYTIYALAALTKRGFNLERLPFSIKVMLENVLRREDGENVTAAHVEALARWNGAKDGDQEFSFMPARVLLQDFTGVPVVADLAVMRDAIRKLGGDPAKINPLQPADLVIDHSVQVDSYGQASSFARNAGARVRAQPGALPVPALGAARLRQFPRGAARHRNRASGQPRIPGAGGLHFARTARPIPTRVFGTDSHTTMINGLGVVGWGVGGIEAEVAMLGRSSPMLIPQVIGFRLKGKLHPGATATDLVLTVTQMLRKKGVVNKFVEYFGDGIASLSVADRATIGNMSPEYGATIGFFPVDDQTLAYLRLTGRAEEQVQAGRSLLQGSGLVPHSGRARSDFHRYAGTRSGEVEPSLAGPRRPQDRVTLADARSASSGANWPRKSSATTGSTPKWSSAGSPRAAIRRSRRTSGCRPPISVAIAHTVAVEMDGAKFPLGHGSLVIAAITSCTNTSNPSVMIAAGLLAKKAVERGAHGQAVGQDQPRAGLQGRDGVPQARRPDDVSRSAAFQPGRLRLHDLYRQQRAGGGTDRGRGQERQPGGRRDPQRESQFRGPHQPGRALQLPRLAAAGGRLRDRGHDGYRS